MRPPFAIIYHHQMVVTSSPEVSDHG